MENNGYTQPEASRKGLWKLIDRMEGDKVIWIIVLLLMLISVLAIFSSTPLLSDDSRIEIMKNHGLVAIFGLGVIIGLYNIKKIGIFRFFSQMGFFLTLMLLLILDLHMNLGFIKAQHINGAWRTLSLLGFQIHVFEVAKVALRPCQLAFDIEASGIPEEAVLEKMLLHIRSGLADMCPDRAWK